MNTGQSAVRVFGKLPAHGDFVCRGFTPAERDARDRWLSGSIEAARAMHGTALEERYDRAPPWRFVVREDDGARAGAIALSQDAAGRRFPVMLDVASPSPRDAGAVEALLYDAIVGSWDVDTLVAAVALDGDDGDRLEADRWWFAGGGGGATADGVRPPDLLARMLGVELPA